MAQRTYATPSDYFDFLGDEIPDPFPEKKQLEAMLRRASIVIDGRLRLAVYNTDEDGYPTDADVSEALKDATCAQADWFENTDDLTGAESQQGVVKIGSVSLGGSGATGSASSTKSAADSRISPEAVEILRNAGLIGSAVNHW
ncbi:hypothetical protein [Paramicrobacterium chengjingii]|uniref:Uncharacterized protein n=1 Tax=Paramicrobacterium chengjingii TaxID=2769067 RepID=A0ABX6YLL7_9MICO|nr:hypothetical protein [Microbacterium chengjingii]QPZ39703.1 hypothetical protein HCR76_06565 [Microbacterium chengjingii]